jgi:hypothetical protein
MAAMAVSTLMRSLPSVGRTLLERSEMVEQQKGENKEVGNLLKEATPQLDASSK